MRKGIRWALKCHLQNGLMEDLRDCEERSQTSWLHVITRAHTCTHTPHTHAHTHVHACTHMHAHSVHVRLLGRYHASCTTRSLVHAQTDPPACISSTTHSSLKLPLGHLSDLGTYTRARWSLPGSALLAEDSRVPGTRSCLGLGKG